MPEVKLTGLDFPEGLLYSRDYLWVRPGEGGDAGEPRLRVGLHFFALPRGGDVYFVKLPPRGSALERGKAFGFVDLAGSTFELRAPVSGKIVRKNDDLRDDAGLVAGAPFEGGWLIEVEGAPEAHVKALLDREQALRYYSFIPSMRGKTLTARQQLAKGRPWASDTAVHLGDDLIVRGRLLSAGGNEVFTPDWVPGDGWRVVVRQKGTGGESGDEATERTYDFAVLGDDVFAGDDCTKVISVEVVGEGAPAATSLRLYYFRKDDFTLAAVDEVAVHDPSVFSRTYNDRGRDAFVRIGIADPIVLDHPKMPASCDDEARDVEVEDEAPVKQIVRFRAASTRMEVELRAEELGQKLVSRQVWERGLPWWSEAVRERDGVELLRATLVRA
jgi:glycine cleavage system H protein